jgi:FkbM family methyltransferase
MEPHRAPAETPLPPLLRLTQCIDFPRKLGVCERLFARSLTRHGTSWVRTAAGIPWKLDLTSQLHRWMVYGKYECAGFVDWAWRHLPSDGIIVDSGANVGQMLVSLVGAVARGMVLAFEPCAEAAQWLRECLARNRDLPVVLIEHALGEACGVGFLHGSQSGHGLWSRIAGEGDHTPVSQPVQIVRLADELERRNLSRVNLWKLDVEGHEVPALKGAEPFLKRHAIHAIYVELVDENGRKVMEYLESLGYRLHLVQSAGRLVPPERKPGFELPQWTNGLFLPRSV